MRYSPTPPAAIDPATGWAHKLTPEEIAAENPQHLREHPEDVLNQYQNSFYGPNNFAYNAGQHLRQWATQPNAIGDFLNRGPLAGAGLGALAGGALGGIGGAIGGHGSAGRMALLGALLGGGLGAYSGYQRKSAGWKLDDPRADIQALLNSAPLSLTDKIKYSQAVGMLPESQARELRQLLNGSSGAIIGAIIARFLMQTGVLGTMFGAALGSFAGNLFNRGNRDALGYNTNFLHSQL